MVTLVRKIPYFAPGHDMSEQVPRNYIRMIYCRRRLLSGGGKLLHPHDIVLEEVASYDIHDYTHHNHISYNAEPTRTSGGTLRSGG